MPAAVEDKNNLPQVDMKKIMARNYREFFEDLRRISQMPHNQMSSQAVKGTIAANLVRLYDGKVSIFDATDLFEVAQSQYGRIQINFALPKGMVASQIALELVEKANYTMSDGPTQTLAMAPAEPYLA